MRLFLDTSVRLAACGSAHGSSRALFDYAPAQRWELLASPWVVGETVRNLPKLPPAATGEWSRLRPRLVIVDDVVSLDRALVFPMSKVGGTPDLGAYEAGTLTNFNAFIYETLPANASDAQHAAAFDFDGDGAKNLDEWIAGTVVTDPASVFRVTEVSRSGTILSITFPTVVGRSYTLESSTDFLTWTPRNANLPALPTRSPFPTILQASRKSSSTSASGRNGVILSLAADFTAPLCERASA